MGNAQSAGHQNRLSKPKTNSNSPPLPAKGESPASTPSKYADLSASDRYQIREELLSPIDQDSADSRPSSDGDDGLGELASQLQRRLSTLSRSNSLSCFGSKQSSTTKLANLPGSNISLASNSHPVDLETALRILQEVKKNASPEDLAALQQALQPSTSPIPEQVLQQRSSIINRSSSSLTRRRSIVATPGLATRTSMVEPNRMSRTWNSWKTPQLDPKEEAKWRKESTGKSPLARLAASESADGRESPAPRAQTPGDLDYSHLGSLRLGSLVVTNGAASPAPSTKESHRMSTPDLSQEEDYFTASDGHSSPTMMQHVPKKHHRRSKSSGPPSASAMRNLRVPRDSRAEATLACNSPLKTEHHGRNSYDQTEREELQLQSRKSARMLAQDYMSELPISPYAQSTFGNEAYDEGIVAIDSSKTFREEALRILDGAVLCETTQPVPVSQRLSCDSSGEKQKKRNLIGRPRPKKADSGYSSGGSLQSKHGSRDGKQEGTVPTLSKKPSVVADMLQRGNGSETDDTSSLYTLEQMLSQPTPKRPLPAIPVEEEVTSPRPMSLQLPDSSMSLLSDAGTSLKSPISVVSHASNSSINSAQKRLQKRRPSFQELPIVQSCQPIPEGSIPDIPAQVRSKFERRLSECPGMDCLTQTYPSKEHVDNAESVIEPFEDAPLDFPFPATWENRLSDLSQLEDDRPPTPPPHRTRRSLSLFRRKSSAKVKEDAYEQENASRSVVDLGTVATALGSSPYDAAMQKPRKHSRTVTSPTHPHQLGNALPRAKSMVNMDAETAAEFARMRSKDRASLRPPMPQRPRSYHDVNLEAGEGKALKRRPRSFYEDQPPMPHEAQRGTSEMNGVHAVEAMPAAEEHSNSKLRAKATVRGQVVSQLIDKYDRYGQKVPRDAQAEHDWEPHARLWNQRRKSMGEGLRHQTRDGQGEWFGGNESAGPQPPTPRVDFGRYSGGLDYGYERGRGVGGSAGTRQLYSYASRKSLQYSHQYGVDLSDVPVFIQRA